MSNDVLAMLSEATLRSLPPEHVQAAMRLEERATVDVKCGQPTKKGHPCTHKQAHGIATCIHHATDEDHWLHLSLREQASRVVQEWRDGLESECSRWPVTDRDRSEVEGLAALVDDEYRHAMHAYDLIWRWQRGRCAICGLGNPKGPYDGVHYNAAGFVIDHDHVTGLMRGWLCTGCNISEGTSGSGQAERYRENPPAVMLGIKVRYWSPIFGWAKPASPPSFLAADPSYLVAAAVAAGAR